MQSLVYFVLPSKTTNPENLRIKSDDDKGKKEDGTAWLSVLFQQNQHSIFICQVNCTFTRLNTIFMHKTIHMRANIILVT